MTAILTSKARSLYVLFAVALAFTIFVSACGGDDTPTPTERPQPAATPAHAGADGSAPTGGNARSHKSHPHSYKRSGKNTCANSHSYPTADANRHGSPGACFPQAENRHGASRSPGDCHVEDLPKLYRPPEEHV